MADKPIIVTTPSGKTGAIDPELARIAEMADARNATLEEIDATQRAANLKAQDAALRARFETGGDVVGNIEGLVAPNVAGAMRGLSGGLSDPVALAAADAIGGREAREGMRERLNSYREYAPVQSVGSELGAIAGSALVGNESGLAGAPGLVGRLGGAVEAGGARALGGGLLARGAGVVARGAVEGAAFGVGGAVSEASLADKDLTSEAVIAGAKHGAIGGAAAAGVLGAAGKGLTTAFGKPSLTAYEAVAGREFGEAAPGVGKALQEEAAIGGSPARTSFDTAAETFIKTRPGQSAETADKLGEAWANKSRVFAKSDEAVQGATRQFSAALDDALAAGRKADMASFGEAKVNQMARLVDPAQVAGQREAIEDFGAKLQQAVEDLKARPTAEFSAKAERRVNAHLMELGQAAVEGDGVKMFTVADNLKRMLGKEAQFGRGPFGLSAPAREFDALYHDLQQTLESPVWGGAGKAQQEVNRATARMLGEGKLFTRKFTTEFGGEMGRPSYVADPRAIKGFMGALTDAGNDLDAKGVDTWIEARKQFLDAASSNYTFDAATNSAIAKERTSLDKLATIHKQTTKDVALANQVKQALTEERERSLGGVLGLVQDATTKPYTMLQRIASLEQATQSVLGRSQRGVQSLVGTKVAPGMSAPKASGQGFFSSLLASAGNTESRGAQAAGARADFQRRADQIATLSSNPAMLSDRIGRSVGPATDGAPGVTAAAVSVAQRGVSYLANALPPPRQDRFTLQPQFQTLSRASDAEMSKFFRIQEALDNPTMVLDQARNGSLTPDHVEAVKAVYPKLYDQMRTQLMRELVTSKSELPYGRRVQLGILLDLPTDQTLAPDFVSAIQATYTASEKAGVEPPPPQLSQLDVASSLQTSTQSAVEGQDR